MLSQLPKAECRMMSTEQWSPADIPLAGEPVPDAPVRRRLRATEEPAQPAAVTGNPSGSDEMCQRLKDASAKCQENYSAWRLDKGAESELSESLHELRRAVARIEIEIAASHSGEGALRPIPIPLHRAHK
jgi:hypothetical protein